ncbi:LuxR family transcriptional regulator, partial [Burkholderia multivorans]|uniref:FHA domain-containing protein n=1 Tax=Burkholderia multivorans TaxID=87883 RepID=UPI000DB6FACC
FLLYRDATAAQRIAELPADRARVVLGRALECDVCLSWGTEVSRVHAELEQVGGHWVVTDDGLSRNGTYVGGERVEGRHRLMDGDVLRLGET